MSGQIALLALHSQELRRVEVFLRGCPVDASSQKLRRVEVLRGHQGQHA